MSGITLGSPKGIWDWLKLYSLYRRAFPALERKPFGIIVKMYRSGNSHIWCVRREGKFLGLATTVNGGDLILLDYFAIEQAQRGQGVGTAAMLALQTIYRDKGLFVEIESTREPGPDQILRIKRKHFYETVGMADLHTGANVFSVPMELLGSRCSLNYEAYRNFYREHYSLWAAEHIMPLRDGTND